MKHNKIIKGLLAEIITLLELREDSIKMRYPVKDIDAAIEEAKLELEIITEQDEQESFSAHLNSILNQYQIIYN